MERSTTPSTRRPAAAAALALGLLLAPAAAGAAASPWVLLETLRAGLREAGPLTARFVQTYIPAGFDSGDQESGHLSIWLPSCLRWNYDEGKSFLVCDGEVHHWNEDEESGRVYHIEPEQETGLDLLLVEVAALRERYVAGSESGEEGTGDVIALALPPGEGSFRARIALDAAGTRVTGLEYTDDEGNLTRFEIDGYQSLAHTALFLPPAGIEWRRE